MGWSISHLADWEWVKLDFLRIVIFVVIMRIFSSQGLVRPRIIKNKPSRIMGVIAIVIFIVITGFYIYRFKKFNEKHKKMNFNNLLSNLIFIRFIGSGLYFTYRGIKFNFF